MLAVQLAFDAYAFRGVAEAAGWTERASMLVVGRAPSAAAAFAELLHAHLAMAQHDPDAARAGAETAERIARLAGATDVEMLAHALSGLALVALGRVREGMLRLDGAAASAVSGEVVDADAIEGICCYMIDACKRVRDLARANEWCERVRGIAERYGDRNMFAVCRTHYADVLVWHGDFEQAEEELTAAARELASIRVGREVDALVRLADLRRRQGRVSEAETLLAQCGDHRFHPLVCGLLALDRSDTVLALDEAGRFLRRIGAPDRFERVTG